jgi:hypothetical protein
MRCGLGDFEVAACPKLNTYSTPWGHVVPADAEGIIHGPELLVDMARTGMRKRVD